jgi:hypothetical protein
LRSRSSSACTFAALICTTAAGLSQTG